MSQHIDFASFAPRPLSQTHKMDFKAWDGHGSEPVVVVKEENDMRALHDVVSKRTLLIFVVCGVWVW